MANKQKITFQPGSGNVFSDLNLPDAQDKQTKVRLIVIINRIIEDRGLSQAQAAEALGINQPKVSALQAYKLAGFSVERLMHFVTALEHDVFIEVRPKTDSVGAGSVVVAQAA